MELEDQHCMMRYLRAIRMAALKLGASLDLEHVLQTVVATMVTDFDSALARIWLYDEATKALHLRGRAGLSSDTADCSPVIIDDARDPHQVAAVARTRTA